MDDLISRQALLDKFEPWLKVKDYNDGELNMLKAILYEIRFMRSAQPETATITIGRTKGEEIMPDKKEVGELLYEIYRIESPHLNVTGVIAKKYYCQKLWELLFGEEEKPYWMN